MTTTYLGPRQRQALSDIQALKDLIADRGQPAVERTLGVHRTTILRWLQGTVKINQAKASHVRMLLGHLPGTDGKWEGWCFKAGKLCYANGESYTPEEVIQGRWVGGWLHTAHERIKTLEAKLAEVETRLTPANENQPKPLALVAKGV